MGDGTAQRRRPGTFSTREAAAASGLSYRQVDYLRRTRRFQPSIRPGGSGNFDWWSQDDVARLTAIRHRLDWGMTLDAALRAADPPLPPPLSSPTVCGTGNTARMTD